MTMLMSTVKFNGSGDYDNQVLVNNYVHKKYFSIAIEFENNYHMHQVRMVFY